MPQYLNQPLYPDTFYHIYNRGNNRENLFYNEDNYEYFIMKYRKYLSDFMDTYCYCLLPNHFHFFVKVKPEKEIRDLVEDLANLPVHQIISEQFRLFFLGYAKAISKQQKRTGSLFQKPFRRKKVTDDRYMTAVIYYIHNNPVHHGFRKRLTDYPLSSYPALCGNDPCWLKRDEVISHFGGLSNFIEYHNKQKPDTDITDFIIEEDE